MLSTQLPPPHYFDLMNKMGNILVEALFGDYFYDDDLNTHSSDVRHFTETLVTGFVWPRYRRSISRKIQRIAKLEASAAEHWKSKLYCSLASLASRLT